MKLHTTLRRRGARLALFGVLAAGWLCAVIGAIVSDSPLLAIGAALAGAASIAMVKLMFESSSATARTASELRQLSNSTNGRVRSLSRTVEQSIASLAELRHAIDAGASSTAERMGDLRRALEAQRADLGNDLARVESYRLARRHLPRPTGKAGELGLRNSLTGLWTHTNPTTGPELTQETSVDSATNDPGTGGSMSGNA